MLTEIYIEALLVDENLADQVWELWHEGIITDGVVAWVWWLIASGGFRPETSRSPDMMLRGCL